MSSTATATLQPVSTQRLRTRLLTRTGRHHPAAVTVSASDRPRANGLDTAAVTGPTPLSSSEGCPSATPQTPLPPTSATCTPPSTPPPSLPSPPAVPRRTALAVTTEALKYDPQADARFARKRKRRAAGSGSGARPRKSLVFRETVRVVPIPLRTEYSARVRARLWSSAAELYENAVRNTVEFAHEGWDWRKVCEDEHMHVCVATGELIHPCHYTMAGAQPPEKE